MWLSSADESLNIDVNVNVTRSVKNVQGITEHGGGVEVYERLGGSYARLRRKANELIVVSWPKVARETIVVIPKLSALRSTQDKDQSISHLNRAKQVSQWSTSINSNQLRLAERRTWHEPQHHPQRPTTTQRDGVATLWVGSKSETAYHRKWTVKTLEKSIACKRRRAETATN